jgi:predicted dehydrogenase
MAPVGGGQLAVAIWLLGPIRRIFAWLGTTEVVPGIVMDAPSTLVWEHDNGARAVLEITFAIDTYFRSSHDTGDERVEVTGSKGCARCNRISAQGRAEPAVEVYCDGMIRSYHDLDDQPPDAFAAMAARTVRFFKGETDGPVMSGEDARQVLTALLAGIESGRLGQFVDVPVA